MRELKLGDITVKDSGPLGCDFYIGDNRIMWLNTMGEDELLKWISNRPKGVESEIDRTCSGRIRPLPKRKKHNLGSVVKEHIENKTGDCPFVDNPPIPPAAIPEMGVDGPLEKHEESAYVPGQPYWRED